MRAELLTLTDNTDGFATVLIARGAGTGINRPQVTVRNEAAITQFGVREAVHDFTASDLADLVEQAEAKLAEVSNPARFQTVEIRVFGDDVPLFQLGDRVRFSDSRLGMTTTAEITELRWRDDSVVLALGELPVNLVGLFTADRDAERAEAALGLAVPTGLRVVGTLSGLDVSVNAFAGSRAVGIEVHVSSRRDFNPGAHTLAAEVFGTRASINGLVPGVRYYVAVRAFDERGFRSGFTPVVAGVVKLVGEEGLEPDLAEAVRHAEIVGEVVDAGREVWDLANSIPDLLDTLDLEPDDAGQFHAIQQNAAGVSSIVGKLGLSPSDPLQFSSIKQTATEISSVVSTLDLDADDPLQFSSIKQTASGIHSIVALLDGDPDDAEQFSSIRQLVDEIDLRVAQGEVISSINLSTEGVRIAGKRLELNGDVDVKGSFRVSGGNVQLDANTIVNGNFKVKGNTVELDGNTSIKGDFSVGGGNIFLNNNVRVTGNMDITNSSQTGYSFRVRDASNTIKAALGRIDGRGGAPSNTYGLFLDGANLYVDNMVKHRTIRARSFSSNDKDEAGNTIYYVRHSANDPDFVFWPSERGSFTIVEDDHSQGGSLLKMVHGDTWKMSFNPPLREKFAILVHEASGGSALAVWTNTGTGSSDWTRRTFGSGGNLRHFARLSPSLIPGTVPPTAPPAFTGNMITLTPPSGGWAQIGINLGVTLPNPFPSGYNFNGIRGHVIFSIIQGDIG